MNKSRFVAWLRNKLTTRHVLLVLLLVESVCLLISLFLLNEFWASIQYLEQIINKASPHCLELRGLYAM
jgi:hypothetical protein